MKHIIIILLTIMTFASCTKNNDTVGVGLVPTYDSNGQSNVKKVQTLNFFAMGTPLSVLYISDKKEKQLEKKIIDFITEFDKENSSYKKESYISKINNLNDNEEIKVPEYFCKLLEDSKNYLKKTEGNFNITYKSPKEFRNFNNIKIDCNKNIIKVIKKGTILDTGGIAKGYSIDKTGELLKKEGYKNFLVNYGGDILVCGKKPNTPRLSKAKPPRSSREFKDWKVGIKNPLKPTSLLKTITRTDVALLRLHDTHSSNNAYADRDAAVQPLYGKCYSVATSGDYERYTIKDGKKLSHIKNPKTGKSIEGAHSITVIADNATLADTLATAISVGHKDADYIKRMKNKFNLEVYLLTGKDLKLREIK